MNPQLYQEVMKRRMAMPIDAGGNTNAATPSGSGGGSAIDRISAYISALLKPLRRKKPIGVPGSRITPEGDPIEEPTPIPMER